MLYRSTITSTFGEGKFPESVKASLGDLAARSDLRWRSMFKFKSLATHLEEPASLTFHSQDPTKIGFVRTWGWKI